MTFMLENHLTFINSFQFMSSGLNKLFSNLSKKALKYTSEIFKGQKSKLMSQEGVYPYDYMETLKNFNEKKLLNKDDFYKILNGERITDK